MCPSAPLVIFPGRGAPGHCVLQASSTERIGAEAHLSDKLKGSLATTALLKETFKDEQISSILVRDIVIAACLSCSAFLQPSVFGIQSCPDSVLR